MAYRSIILPLLALILAFGGKQSYAQQASEIRLLIDSGQYEKALPMARQLVAKSPKQPDNNYLLGSLLYKVRRYDEAVEPLRVATSKRADAYELLADAYAKGYHFSEALTTLERYRATLVKKKQETTRVDVEMERMRRGSRLLDRAEWIEVFDSVRIRKQDLLSAYHLTADNGNISWLQGSQAEATTFVNGRGDFSLVTRRNSAGRYDLYEANFIHNRWSDVQPLDRLNTEYDDNYPSMRADGITVLFASNRPNGLGGYDLYMARRDLEEGTFLEPVLLGMPFNSPFDDYLLVYDEARGIGFFASDRFCPADTAVVYTFAINDAVRPVATDDLDVKRGYASLRSIAVTLDEDRDYSELIAMARDVRIDAEKKASEYQIYFPMQGLRIYTKWNDFRSREARSRYQDVVAKAKKLDQSTARLEQLRRQYGEAPTAERNRLRQEILQLENSIPAMQREINALEKEVRNLEMQSQ